MDQRFQIINGDCREALKPLDDCSIDSVVCDPPYELGFMGKGWDRSGIAYDVNVWIECLRVLKPGGHLLAFGGSRTYHRLACAIEDAGFEMRDDIDFWYDANPIFADFYNSLNDVQKIQLHQSAGASHLSWGYGSGFPKSLNVSSNLCEQGSVCTCNEPKGTNTKATAAETVPSVRGFVDTENARAISSQQNVLAEMREHVDWSRAQWPEEAPQDGEVPAVRVGVSCAEQEAEGGLLQPFVQGESQRQPLVAVCGEHEGPEAQASIRSKQPGVEGRRDGVQEEGQLHRGAICASAAVGVADGPQGRLHHGASVDHGSNVRLSSHQNGSGQPQESQAIDQRGEQSGAISNERGSQAWGGWPLCGMCGKPMVPKGIGSALKPAHEPIILARKPLNSTLVANVLQHGTGGLNIDGCRIPTDERLNAGSRRLGDGIKFGFCEPSTEYEQNANGRWPSNIITDGSSEVLAAFPDALGQQGDLNGHSKDRLSKGIFGDMKAARDAVARLDSGSAARFFYCAKATQEDREEGCEDLERRVADTTHKRPRTELDDPRRAGVTPRKNHHPTVKPTDLMRYLCRLITPPGGIVLDPFCGSGSTGKAAMLEGLRFIGIDLSAEYCELAQLRIEAVTRQGLLFASA